MLMLEHLDTLAETAAKAISNIKFDKVVVWENGGPPTATAAATRPTSCRAWPGAMPPMMQVMKDIGGVEMPEYVARLTPDAPPKNGETADAAPAAPPPPKG